MKRRICISLALLLSVFSCFNSMAAEQSARTISIFKVEGAVKMTKGTAKEFTAKAGMKLAGGYTISTGKDAYAWLKLDEDTLVKLDQRSKVSISKASATKLSLSVLSGAVSVDAGEQQDGNTLEVRAANTALAVRGTTFAVECENEGGILYIMFSGSAYVDGNLLETGRRITVTDATGAERQYDVGAFGADTELSSFILETILENRDALIENGIFTPEELEQIQEILPDIREKEEQQEQQKALENEQRGNPQAAEDNPPAQGDTTPRSRRSSSSSTPPPAAPAPEPEPEEKIVLVVSNGNEQQETPYSSLDEALTSAGAITADEISVEVRGIYTATAITIPDDTTLKITSTGKLTVNGNIYSGSSGNGNGRLENHGELKIGQSSSIVYIYCNTISNDNVCYFESTEVHCGSGGIINSGHMEFHSSVIMLGAYDIIGGTDGTQPAATLDLYQISFFGNPTPNSLPAWVYAAGIPEDMTSGPYNLTWDTTSGSGCWVIDPSYAP